MPSPPPPKSTDPGALLPFSPSPHTVRFRFPSDTILPIDRELVLLFEPGWSPLFSCFEASNYMLCRVATHRFTNANAYEDGKHEQQEQAFHARTCSKPRFFALFRTGTTRGTFRRKVPFFFCEAFASTRGNADVRRRALRGRSSRCFVRSEKKETRIFRRRSLSFSSWNRSEAEGCLTRRSNGSNARESARETKTAWKKR